MVCRNVVCLGPVICGEPPNRAGCANTYNDGKKVMIKHDIMLRRIYTSSFHRDILLLQKGVTQSYVCILFPFASKTGIEMTFVSILLKTKIIKSNLQYR